MKLQRIIAIIQMEMKRFFKEPLIFVFTLLLVPVLILFFGLIMGSNYGWGEEYSIFEIMVPGFLAYASLLSIYEVASSIAGESESGIQSRVSTTPLTSSEYIFGQMISYTLKPLLQFGLGLGVAFAVGFRPDSSILGYLLAAVFLIFLTVCSVGFGMITANFAKTASTAGGLAFIFIVPQQIFATFIPSAFLGVEKFAKFLPSYHATDGISLIFTGTALTDSQIWIRLGTLLVISIAIYVIGMLLYNKNRNLI